MALVTIRKVHDAALAQLVRMKLDAEGIPVHLGSAGHASLFGVQDSYSAIRVQVPETFEARARTIVHELMATLEALPPEAEEDEGG
ncbi:hypothetical protein HFP89_11590 [Wenzhouxiangella sp. XN79A]|uniref:putative signal transducing protein n=1 Tax=Wenzhouxiangella sp. XN79A TaxID=2724193 RepID=UPI00144AB8B0|nr:DUF2007 domain-containing protein [Wenzhouxiangella sp. XN79A]NKI35805.1 hypothetical protein [Wenzhouxiangella sp. XN79A]